MKSARGRLDAAYEEFASRISFLELTEEEFREVGFPFREVEKEVAALTQRRNWGVEDLSDYVRRYPRCFEVFEAMFQLQRFTNVQVIHFAFDTVKLNSRRVEALFEYLVLNLKHDPDFAKLFADVADAEPTSADTLDLAMRLGRPSALAYFKIAVAKYVSCVTKEVGVLERRMARPEFSDVPIRVANYILTALRLNTVLNWMDVRTFLANKRVPRDSKGLHGKYAHDRVRQALVDGGFLNVDDVLNKHRIKTLDSEKGVPSDVKLPSDRPLFCTERYVKGVVKGRASRPKKLDVVILQGRRPRYLFEVNFYTTSGTKIGINQGEYVQLDRDIRKKLPELEFYWITDGNYWLCVDGMKRFAELQEQFRAVFNLNSFAENLDRFR